MEEIQIVGFDCILYECIEIWKGRGHGDVEAVYWLDGFKAPCQYASVEVEKHGACEMD